MKKTAFLINTMTCGGGEKLVSDILKYQNSKNIPTELILLQDEGFFQIPDKIKKTSLSNMKFTASYLVKFINIFINAWRLKKYCGENQIDVLYSFLFRSHFTSLIAKILGLKSEIYLSVQENILSYYKTGINSLINRILIKKLFPLADKIIIISRYMQYEMSNIMGIKNQYYFIPNFCNTAEIIKKAQSDDMLVELPPDKKFIIYLGRLHRKKRVDILVRAFEQVLKEMDDLNLLIVGDGEEKSKIISLAKKLKIFDKIIMCGSLNNPFPLLKKAECMVLTSESEGLPVVILEAMACQCPIIAADCSSGPREVLAPQTDFKKRINSSLEIGESGILVPVADFENTASAILKLLNDNSLAKKIKKVQAKTIIKYSAEKIIPQYLNLMQ